MFIDFLYEKLVRLTSSDKSLETWAVYRPSFPENLRLEELKHFDRFSSLKNHKF